MRLKALTAGLVLAVVAAVTSISAGHAKALTTNQSNVNGNPNSVTVAPGDTLSAIASRHGTTYVRLFDANSVVQDPDLIVPGEVLRIPAADEQLPDRLAALAPAPNPVPAAAPPAPAKPVSAPAPVTAAAPSGGVWYELAQCESGGNWAANTGNGFYGGLQFTLSSWQAAGGSGYPNQASASEQIARAQVLQSRQGWGAWPACSAKLGL